MRKRYALIIRDAILDVHWDWDLNHTHIRTPLFRCRNAKEFNLYFKAYNRELENVSRRELSQTHKKIRESLSKL